MHKRFGPHKWALFIKQVMDYVVFLAADPMSHEI